MRMTAREDLSVKDRPWIAEAACRGLDTEIFFPVSEEDEGEAKLVCQTCPVQAQCLDWALRTRQEDGVWGGLGERERRQVRRRRVERKDPLSLIMAQVERRGDEDCWPWQGGRNSNGIPMTWIECSTGRRPQRAILEYRLGRSLDDARARTTCGVQDCCNPAHLFEGTGGTVGRPIERAG